MKLSEKLKKAIKEEIAEILPKYTEDVDVSEEDIKVTGLCVIVKEHLFIEIKEK